MGRLCLIRKFTKSIICTKSKQTDSKINERISQNNIKTTAARIKTT